jgi:hypothetical protein
MLKNNKKPRIHTFADAYQDYVATLLEQNEDYWGKRAVDIKNRNIYKKSGDSIIEITSHDKYKTILTAFFKAVGSKLIEGEKFNMLYGNGYLFVRRIERSFKNPKINWGESNKYRQELIDAGETPLKDNNGGKPWLVYYIDDEYFRLAWQKPTVCTKNLKFYKFLPARGRPGRLGFREQMSKVIKLRPELKDRYQYLTIKDGRVS